jgi:hypothetical protein
MSNDDCLLMNGQQPLPACSKPKHLMQQTCGCLADDINKSSSSKNGIPERIVSEQSMHDTIFWWVKGCTSMLNFVLVVGPMF